MKGAAAGLYFSQQLSNTLFTVIVSRGTLLLFNKNIDVSDILSDFFSGSDKKTS